MSRFVRICFLSSAFLLFALPGCGGDDGTGNGDGNGNDDTRLPDGEQVFEVEDGTLEITAMRVLVKEIVFDSDGPDESISKSVPGTFDIHLIAGESEPEYPRIDMGEGTWDSTYLGVEIDDDVDGRDSIELEANYHSDGSSTDVLFIFNSGEVFEPEFPAQMNLDQPLTIDIAKVFHPSQWFPTIDLSNAEVGDDGVITLSESSNTGQYNEIADALDKSTQSVNADTFRE